MRFAKYRTGFAVRIVSSAGTLYARTKNVYKFNAQGGNTESEISQHSAQNMDWFIRQPAGNLHATRTAERWSVGQLFVMYGSVQRDATENCVECGLADPPSCGRRRPARRVMWIQCDTCHYWIHLQCSSLKRPPTDNQQYHCGNCRRDGHV